MNPCFLAETITVENFDNLFTLTKTVILMTFFLLSFKKLRKQQYNTAVERWWKVTIWVQI